jgi:CheY-like chemotaxis protein
MQVISPEPRKSPDTPESLYPSRTSANCPLPICVAITQSLPRMQRQHVLAVIQADLQLICALRGLLEENGQAMLSVSRNSEEAILYLRGVGIYSDRSRYPVPDVVLLDCASPTGEDLEVLAWMREQEAFRILPVVMLCPAEQHHHVSCALDEACWMVDRDDLSEIRDVLGNLIAAQIHAAVAA